MYGATTEAHPVPDRRRGLARFLYLGRLYRLQRLFKPLEVLLSLLAFICEEVVSQCTLCGGLYFFEFVSCSAFLLSLLVLTVYCTPLYDKVDGEKVKSSDFYITVVTGCVFILASIIFATTHDKTSAEFAAVVFGFLASFMFLGDFFTMIHEKRQASQQRKSETSPGDTLQPLNA